MILRFKEVVDGRGIFGRVWGCEAQDTIGEARVARRAVAFQKLFGHARHAPSEFGFRVVQALFHGGQRQIEEGRHLAARALADVVERHHLTLACRQRADGLSDKASDLGLLGRGGRLHAVGRQTLVSLRQRLGDGAAAAQTIAVLVHHGAQPTDERLRMPQRRQLTEGVEKRLLRRVLGKVIVAKQREGVANRHVLKPHDEAVKRAKLTGLRPLHLRRQRFVVNPGWLHRCPDSPFPCTCPAKTHAVRKWILEFATRLRRWRTSAMPRRSNQHLRRTIFDERLATMASTQVVAATMARRGNAPALTASSVLHMLGLCNATRKQRRRPRATHAFSATGGTRRFAFRGNLSWTPMRWPSIAMMTA